MRAFEDKEPKGMDDALNAFWIPYNSDKYAKNLIISSKTILDDYRKWRENEFELPKLR